MFDNAFKRNFKLLTNVSSYLNYQSDPNCTINTMLGGLIGGGIAASLSDSNEYGWTIPLGVVLGAGIGNAEC